jgi:hypothetical protein
MRIFVFLFVLVLSVPAIRADEQARRIQEELRKRQLYFGDIDGRLTPQTCSALRAYQQRKAFRASGDPDAATLQSLGLEPTPSLPDQPVLRSDVALPPGTAEATSAPAAALSVSSTASAATDGDVPPPEPTQPIAEYVRTPPPGAKPLSPKAKPQVQRFVQDYLKDSSSGDPRLELRYYADQVNYLHHGVVDKRTIHRRARQYQKLWPKRNLEMVNAGYYFIKQRPGEIIVKFQTDFDLENDRRQHARGQTLNVLTLRISGNQMRIVSVQEERVAGHPARRPPFLCRLLRCE